MAPKISVVIPVYCVEQYVEKCLETVQKQTLKDIEIITVNDCSPDNSQDIIDRLAKDDKRIKSIILETNGGQGFARNEGLRVATGEYVHFLDSDDYLASLNTYEIFYTRAVRDQADVIRGRVWRKSELQGVKSKLRLSKKEFYFSNDLSSVTLEHHPELLVATAVKNILCKRDFLCDNQIVFKLPKWEDFSFSYVALFKAERITSIPDFITVYRKRAGSTTTTSLKLDRDIDLSFQNVQFVMKMLIEHGVSFEKSQLPLHVRYFLAYILRRLFFDSSSKVISQVNTKQKKIDWIQKARDLFSSLHIETMHFPDYPFEVLADDFSKKRAYDLCYTAIMADRPEFVDCAVFLKKVEQVDFYNEILKTPRSKVEENFQNALNAYVQLDMLKSPRSTDLSENYSKSGHLDVAIIIHAGTAKAGSSYLQNVFSANRAMLLRKGIWYPELGIKRLDMFPHKQTGHSFLLAQRRKEQFEFFVEGLKLLKGQIHTVVLSSEGLHFNWHKKDYIKIFEPLNYDKTKIIAYLRPQYEWLNSRFADRVAGWTKHEYCHHTIDELYHWDRTRAELDYFGWLTKMSEAIGDGKVKPRIFSKSNFYKNDLLEDFLHTSNLDSMVSSRDFCIPSHVANSTNLEIGHIGAIIPYHHRPWQNADYFPFFINKIVRDISTKRKKEGTELSPGMHLNYEQANQIMAKYKSSNDKLMKKFFEKSSGELFSPPIRAAEIVDADKISSDEVDIIYRSYNRYNSNFTQTKHFWNKIECKAQKNRNTSNTRQFPSLKILLKVISRFARKLSKNS